MQEMWYGKISTSYNYQFMSEVQKSPVEWYAESHKKFREAPWKYVNSGGEEAILKQAKEMEELGLIKVLAEQSTKEAAKTKELLDFLNAQISKNRSYSASTMCEVIIEFITTQQNK